MEKRSLFNRGLFAGGFLLFACNGVTAYEGQVFMGTVVHVSDGATLTIQEQKEKIRIHLAGIKGPDLEQPYGIRAKKALGDMVFGKSVKVIKISADEDGAIVGRVLLDGIDISQKMLQGDYHIVPVSDYVSH